MVKVECVGLIGDKALFRDYESGRFKLLHLLFLGGQLINGRLPSEADWLGKYGVKSGWVSAGGGPGLQT